MLDLSILVCSIGSRRSTFAPRIAEQLFGQVEALPDPERVEILMLMDNQTQMLGHKRNLLVGMAQGKYVVFVDDDDRVADDYVAALLDATASDADSIVFQASVSLNGEPAKICDYSIHHKRDHNTTTGYLRIPNHICCVKRDLALLSSFPHVLYGEDAGYSKVLLPHLKTEHRIGRVLYHYDYNSETTATQAWRANRTPARKLRPIVDVVILSKATTRLMQRMTQQAVDSCFNGTNGLPVNITVLEGGAGKYRNATTISKGEKFNYNRFANYGASLGSAEWIMVANNDLIFQDGWLHPLLAAGADVVSPHNPGDRRQTDLTENTAGDVNGRHFSGWCFMIRRSLWERIGGFDEDVDFWCSDDAVVEQVLAAGVQPMLVPDSLVAHTGSQTLKAQPPAAQNEMRWRNLYIFNTKYGKVKYADHPQYRAWVARHGDKP